MQPRRINKSPATLEEPEKSALKKMLTTPPVKKIDLHFPLGLEVTARNLKGVTIKDALDAIYKQFRKKVCLLPQFTVIQFQSLVVVILFGAPVPGSLALTYANFFVCRPMMSWRPPCSQASSGTRRSPGLG